MIGWLQVADRFRSSTDPVRSIATGARRRSSAVESASHDPRTLDAGTIEIVPATFRIVVIPLVNQPDLLALPLLTGDVIETVVHLDRGHDRIIRATWTDRKIRGGTMS